MLLSITTGKLPVLYADVTLREPKRNTEASQYIVNNYNKLIEFIIKKGKISEDKAHDVLHDMLVNILESEKSGEAFNEDFGDGNISIEQFIFGRTSAYCKNDKYRSDVVETGSAVIYHTEKFENLNGNQVSSTSKERIKAVVIAASGSQNATDKDDDEAKDSFQKAYSTAATSDSADNIEEYLSIREQIETCIDICNLHDFKIINLFKNIDAIAELLGSSRRKKSEDSVFSKLSVLVKENDELAENIRDVFLFAKDNRDLFDIALGDIEEKGIYA